MTTAEIANELNINKWYQKKDGSDNPRLDVFVSNKKEEKSLIPNLYFSSAEINILSLSIF